MKDVDGASPTNVVRVNFKDRITAGESVIADRLQAKLDLEKFELCGRWISHGTICLLFDARDIAVLVPNEFKQRGDLRLNFCFRFHIPDFNFNENGIWATLSFDSGEFFCMVPWRFVYGMQSQELKQGAVWFDNFPKDYDHVEVFGFSKEIADIESAQAVGGIGPSLSDPATVVEYDFSKKP